MKRILISFVVGTLPLIVAFGQSTPLVPSHKPANTAPSGRPMNAMVAKVDGVGLSVRDLQREMQKLFPFAGVHGGRVPGEYAAEVRRRALDQIIFEELVHQEARRKKMTVPAAMFNDIRSQAKSRFASGAEYESYAVQEFGSVQAFENQLRRNILVALLIDQEITQKARVTEAQVREFYNENKSRFMKPESVWIQSISLNFPPNSTPGQRAQARKRAEELISKAKSAKTYEEFGKLAEKFSEDDWRIMMGDHRWVHRGRLPSSVEGVAFRLKAGDVSDVIETSEAFVIVRINGQQPQTQIPFSEVAPALREDLEKAKVEDVRKRFEQRLRSTHKVEEL